MGNLFYALFLGFGTCTMSLLLAIFSHNLGYIYYLAYKVMSILPF